MVGNALIVIDVVIVLEQVPFVEVVGKADNVAPEQIALTCVNTGATFGLTVMVIVVVVAHCPVVGVNV